MVDAWQQVVLNSFPDWNAQQAFLEASYRLGAFRREGRPLDLRRCMRLLHDLIGRVPPDTAAWCEVTATLGIAYGERFQTAPQAGDLDEAIRLLGASLQHTQVGATPYASRAVNLAVALSDRYRRDGDIDDFACGVQWTRVALRVGPKGAHERDMILENLAASLTEMHALSGDAAILNEVIAIEQALVADSDLTTIDHGIRQVSLAMSLVLRFETFGNPVDLDTGVRLTEEAVESGVDPTVRYVAGWKRVLAAFIRERYSVRGLLEDLNRAIELGEEAVEESSPDTPELRARQESLEISLMIRFGRTRNVADLERAMTLMSSALYNTPEGAPELTTRRGNAAHILMVLHRHNENTQHVDDAMVLYRLALDATLPGAVKRPALLAGMADCWTARFRASQDLADLDQAIALEREALDSMPPESPEVPLRKVNLAISYAMRFDAGAVAVDVGELSDAIELLRDAMDATMSGAPALPAIMATLAQSLVRRCEVQGSDHDDQDMQQAISLLEDVVRAKETFVCTVSDRWTQERLQHEIAMYGRMLLLWLCDWQRGNASHASAQTRWVSRLWHLVARIRSRQTTAVLRGEVRHSPDVLLDEHGAASEHAAILDALQQLESHRLHLYGLLASPDTQIDVGVSQRDEQWITGTSGDTYALRAVMTNRRTTTWTPRRRAEARELDAQVAALWEQISGWWPHLGPLREIEAPDLDGVQTQLRELQTVVGPTIAIDLYQLDDRLLIFLLDGVELHLQEVAISEDEVRERAMPFLHWLDEAGPVAFATLRHEVDADLDALLTWLGEQIWPVIADLLPVVTPEMRASGRVPHLLIAPSGVLQRIPLHAMLIPDGSDERLLDRYAVQYLPSSDVLRLIRPGQDARARRGGFTALVPPTAPPLPGCLAQAYFTAQLLNVDPHTCIHADQAATYATLTGVRGGSLLLATHGALVLDQSEQSFVQLADGHGGVAALTSLSLLAGLGREGRLACVDLPACETHGGGEAGLDDGGGVTRALLAGADQVTGGLWWLDHLVALVVGVWQWEGLIEGLTVAQAQRQAVCRVRDADIPELMAVGTRLIDVLERTARSSDAADVRDACRADLVALGAMWAARYVPSMQRRVLHRGVSWWGGFVVLGSPGRLVPGTRGYADP